MAKPLAYAIVTPARNEAEYIELTIRSMIAQVHPPLRWIIVSDGSTDATDEIVGRYLDDYPWIELLRMPERKERHFAGKVHAFRAGYDRVKGLEGGQQKLEDAITAYERGALLRRHCESKLAEAETRVQAIVQRSDGGLAARPTE